VPAAYGADMTMQPAGSPAIHAVPIKPQTGDRPLVITDLELVAALRRASDTRVGDLPSEP
jgi:hypothetical protein